MTRTFALLALGAVLFVGGCTESKRANQAATFADRAADVTCWSFGAQIYEGRSTGKVEFSDTGRVTFVDAANGRLTAIEGDCRIVYRSDEAEGETSAAATESSPPVPSSTVPGV